MARSIPGQAQRLIAAGADDLQLGASTRCRTLLGARREAREDFHRFPPFEGEVTHEAMTTKVVF
jgi:hypothetical protein